MDPAESPHHIEWTRRLADTPRPVSSGAYLLNFLGPEDDDTIRAAFGPNDDRLAAVKQAYDPAMVFRLNQNIRPTA